VLQLLLLLLCTSAAQAQPAALQLLQLLLSVGL
jgi:hypothetical protein